jgi:hypothetical protein
VGELSPVTLSSYGVGKLVSVLVSVADSLAPNSLVLQHLEMEARVGIERGSFDLPTVTHSILGS